jgi:propionyl-CoA carboxylase alpha chain
VPLSPRTPLADDDEVRLGYRLSKDEAKSSFGDDRLFVEKFIEDPRHIEIQLIADSHGNVVALPERECSIQRRNQKVIEESPSVLLDEKTRRAMQDQACALARAVGYESAGTVEFLADKHRNFFFLEMNTRLQVEHPVTEMVTGLDLVELMIKVAAGEKLPSSITGSPVPILGHAFESRVYAEDPFRGFLPSTGRLAKYAEPQTFVDRDAYVGGKEVRADAGVGEGSEISMFYDPMICKLVTHGKTRDDALDRMRASLDAYVIRGVGHNVSFLRALCDHPRFCEGRLTTQFIREEYPDGFQGVALHPENKLHLVAVATIMNAVRDTSLAGLSGRLASAVPPEVHDVVVTVGNGNGASGNGHSHSYAVSLTVEQSVHDHGSEGHVHHDNEDSLVDAIVTIRPLHHSNGAGSGAGAGALSGAGAEAPSHAAAPTTIRLRAVDWSPDAPLFIAQLAQGPKPKAHAKWPSTNVLRVQHMARLPTGFRLSYMGATEDVKVQSSRGHALAAHMKPKAKKDLSSVVVSPMPGTLVSVAVRAGDHVEIGQEVAVVEAMKMQNVLRSPRKGTIKSVARKAGDTLAVDQVILEFEA